MKRRTREDLRLENERLRSRLEDAEETIRAIREGEVDALVVSGEGGEKIYTLRSADQPYRVFVEAMSEGALTLTAGGTIYFCNKRFSEIVGSPLQKVIGSPLLSWCSEEDRHLLQEILERGKRELGTGEVRLATAAGTGVPVRISVSPVNLDEIIVACAVVMDVSERKSAEAEIDSYVKRLEFSNRELESFAFVASHDLQEPLRKLQVFGDLLMQKTGLDEEDRDYLNRMRVSAERMSVLLNSLLEYSRVSTKIQPPGPVDLGHAVELALSNLEIRIAEAGGSVHVSSLPTIRGDKLQMVQLFQNLIGNAMKFHPEDREPRVRIYSRFKENGRSGGREHVIFVQDNGTGFDPAYQDRIFLPFERLVTHGQYEGVGMGLAICKKIVERHGGTITARSTPGKGSTFIITLPERNRE
jgi:PAS domain S-box-containing protein